MAASLAVCIAAFNEQQAIGRTLESVAAQNYDGQVTTFVHVNGTTDNTVGVVEETSDRMRRRVRVSEDTVSGKSRAWNVLRGQAHETGHRYMLFLDADVYVQQDAFAHLYRDMVERQHVAVVANNVADLKGKDMRTRLAAVPSGPMQHICGKGYLLDNMRLQTLFDKQQIEKMPDDLVHEDYWLSLVVGRKNFSTSLRAKVHYTPYGFEELPRMMERYARANAQMELDYPELYNQRASHFRERVRAAYERIATAHIHAPWKIPWHIGSARYRNKLIAKARKELESSTEYQWEVSEASKVV